MSNPSRRQLEETKWILRHVIWSNYAILNYKNEEESKLQLVDYIDLDFIGDIDKTRFLLGYVFLSKGNLISWKATL